MRASGGSASGGSASPPWPGQKAGVAWCGQRDPSPGVLPASCSWWGLFVPAETRVLSSDGWALEEIKPLPG